MNDHHLTELLAEREALRVSRKTVQRLLRAAGLGSPRHRRPPRHRRRRKRVPQAGLLVQMDGSHHPWLEDRGPRLVRERPGEPRVFRGSGTLGGRRSRSPRQSHAL